MGPRWSLTLGSPLLRILRGRGLSQFSPSCYSETAPFQDGKQSQMLSHGFYLTIATTETSPGMGGYATCHFLVLADGLCPPLLFGLVIHL